LTLAKRALMRAGLTCTVERVETAHDFRRGLESGPDLILCDFKLPQFDGLAALEIANAQAPDVPFIFVSGAIGEERAIEALKSGATDYVLKSNLARLVPAVARALKDHDERRIARQTERHFRDLVEASQDWIWEIDVDGRYVFSSSSARTILGWTDAEILGAHYLAHVHEDDRTEIEGALRLTDAKERRLTSATVRIRHRDGSYRWLERHALAIIDDRGLITGFRGTDRDVTRIGTRRAAKKARVESESQLARSDAVAREREYLAYELHDGVCQQLAGISYLLDPLIGPVVQLDPGVARELKHIATLLREVIQTARTLAHDRAGGTERESGDLQGALQVHAVRLQAAHGVTIKVDATALSNQLLSGIAVSELAKLAREAMRNAIRHGRARSIIVRLKDAGHDWQLEIIDDGVGLPSDFMRRGGLGLRSMRHRAARLQGTLEIVRLAPRGTCLRVSWPQRSEK
jgi:two-component system, NarL family, sensor histidine kinase UhpB